MVCVETSYFTLMVQQNTIWILFSSNKKLLPYQNPFCTYYKLQQNDCLFCLCVNIFGDHRSKFDTFLILLIFMKLKNVDANSNSFSCKRDQSSFKYSLTSNNYFWTNKFVLIIIQEWTQCWPINASLLISN